MNGIIMSLELSTMLVYIVIHRPNHYFSPWQLICTVLSETMETRPQEEGFTLDPARITQILCLKCSVSSAIRTGLQPPL